jgi:hypothetical protein
VIDLRRSFWIPEQTVAAIKKGDHTHLRKALKKAGVSGRSFPLTRGRVNGRTGCQDAPQPHRSEQPRSVGIANATARPLHGVAGFLASDKPQTDGFGPLLTLGYVDGDTLPFRQTHDAGTLQRRGVHDDILSALIRSDKAEALNWRCTISPCPTLRRRRECSAQRVSGNCTDRRTSAAGLPSRRPSYTTCRSRLSSVQLRNFTSATSSGRYASQRVRVNAIAPSATMTERVKKLIAGNAALTLLADSHLLGLIEPGDIAGMALYLASDESRMVTGQVLPVDSGVTIS